MDNAPAPSVTDTMIRSIPISQIQPSPYQTRKYFDEDQLQLLALTMKDTGLEQPITVRLSPGDRGQATETGHTIPNSQSPVYELIAGERRLRAAKLLGWTTIEAIVRPGVSDQESATRGLIENLQREDLNPIEEAQGYAKLQGMDSKKWTQQEIAKIVGKQRTYVTEALSLLKLPEEVHKFVERSTISPGHAGELLRLTTPEQQKEMAQKVVKEGWSVKETEKRVNLALGKPPKTGSGKGSSHAPSLAGSPPPQPTLPDPLAEVWPPILSDPSIGPAGSWGISYRGEDTWAFWSKAPSPYSQGALAVWFQKMADALKSPSSSYYTPSVHSAESFQNAKKGLMGSFKPRLPQTPEEEKELEEISIKGGPKAVYAWIYGPDSPMTQAVPVTTWQEMGIRDAAQGLHQVLDGIRKFQESAG